jgi:hypothetical protein
MNEKVAFNPAAFGASRVEKPAPPPIDTTAFNPGAITQRLAAERQSIVDLRTAPLGPVNAWSMSRLFDFESCPHAVYLGKVMKMPTPSGPAAERGTQVHDHIENYIRGEHADVTKEMTGFIKLIDVLREGFAEAKVEVEGDWAFDRQWNVTGWSDKNCWARMKLDAIQFEDPTSARVIDWKTGKKFGNELKHNQQGMGYAIGAFARYPELEYVGIQFAYLDKNDELIGGYTRKQAEMLRPMLTERADKMTTCTDFAPKPSFSACRWCAHKNIQEGHTEPACKYSYEGI